MGKGGYLSHGKLGSGGNIIGKKKENRKREPEGNNTAPCGINTSCNISKYMHIRLLVQWLSTIGEVLISSINQRTTTGLAQIHFIFLSEDKKYL